MVRWTQLGAVLVTTLAVGFFISSDAVQPDYALDRDEQRHSAALGAKP